MTARQQSYALSCAAVAAAALVLLREPAPVSAQSAPARFTGPTSSQPLALSADGSRLAVVNPDNDTVSFFDTKTNTRLAEFSVGREPNGVVLSPDGTKAWVANTVDGTVWALNLIATGSTFASVVGNIPAGIEPYGLAITPSGRKLYVASARSNSVTVIDTATNQAIKTISNVGPEPRGIAITNGGGDDSQELVLVTQFLALPVAGKFDGTDDAKAAHVTVISAATDTVVSDITVGPVADTGFKAAGDAIRRIAPGAEFTFTTGAYPNQLNGIGIRGKFAYLPSTGASPNGPVRFDVNTQSLLSVIDIAARRDAGRTINMHSAVAAQTATPRRFLTVPWAIATKNKTDEALVISAASNVVVKVKLDPATGAATVQSDPSNPGRVLQIPTGKNPRGIVIGPNDDVAYVMNYVSRDVTVIDLAGPVERVTATLRSSSLPAAGTAEDRIQAGKELYHTSIGEFDPAAPGGAAIAGRMSNNGWGSCSSCHPFGLTDNVVWIFPSGPRRSISQHTDFDFTDRDRRTLRLLNWSGERDEEADFELNIRAVSGGQGLIVGADGVTQETAVANLAPLPSKGRNQLKVRGVPAWDALEAYMQFGIRAPIATLRGSNDPDIAQGRQHFIQSNCQSCHGGGQWTSGRVRYSPAPDGSMVSAGQVLAELRGVGTFNAQGSNEVRQNAAAPLGAAGFVPPSLLSISAFAGAFFHGGSANSLEEAMANVAHRSAGAGADLLAEAPKRAQLIKFLQSIDSATAPIPPNTPARLTVTSAAADIGAKLAADSLASAYGTGLASQAVAPSSSPLPVVAGGALVSVQDSAGGLRLGQLFFAGPAQMNFIVPAATANGTAVVTVTNVDSGVSATGNVEVSTVAPAVFTMPGGNVAAAVGLRANAAGAQSPVGIFQCTAVPVCTATPIDLGPAGDIVVVTLFGTGLRKNTDLARVRATISGADAPVLFSGAQGQFAGLDQVNLQIPVSLRGSGEAAIVLTIDGQRTNTSTINVR